MSTTRFKTPAEANTEYLSKKQRNQRIATAIVAPLCFVAIGYILCELPERAAPPPGYNAGDRVCITGPWKLALLLTHLLTFVLIPVAMKVFYDSLPALRLPREAVFHSQLGLSFIMVSVASEIGWHVSQCWYYSNDFTMLNFIFYFFLLSAFALWSDGLVRNPGRLTKLLGSVSALLLVVVSVLYPVGYATNNSRCKIPIYTALTFTFAVLSYRGYKLLDDKRVVWFPVLSVGANMFFVALLQKYGGDPYVNPNVPLNATYHVLHDLAGTLAGVAIFTFLVHLKGCEARLEQRKRAS